MNQGRKTNPHSQNRSKNDLFEGQVDLNLLDENIPKCVLFQNRHSS